MLGVSYLTGTHLFETTRYGISLSMSIFHRGLVTLSSFLVTHSSSASNPGSLIRSVRSSSFLFCLNLATRRHWLCRCRCENMKFLKSVSRANRASKNRINLFVTAGYTVPVGISFVLSPSGSISLNAPYMIQSLSSNSLSRLSSRVTRSSPFGMGSGESAFFRDRKSLLAASTTHVHTHTIYTDLFY